MRFLFLLTITLTASASIIAPTGTFSNVAGTTIVNTPAPGNNNHPGGNSPNTIAIDEQANSIQNGLGVSFDVINDAASSGRSTEYAVTKTVLNNSGETWTNFAMSLNYQFLNGLTFPFDFVVIQFDSDSIPTLTGNGTAGQNLIVGNANQVAWAGINVLPGDSIIINFSVDTCPSCNGIWQLSQLVTGEPTTPEVPEPAVSALVGMGLLLFGFRSKFYQSQL
jgi:hypothetical protein